jgi:hypothetical protein
MLHAEDVRYLEEKGYDYRYEQVGPPHLLVVRNYGLPDGFVPATADLLLEIPAGYPDAGLDMFWMHPEVRLASTNAFPQAADQFAVKLDDRNWQRFSRHGYPWRPGEDSIASYLLWVRRSLEVDAGIEDGAIAA